MGSGLLSAGSPADRAEALVRATRSIAEAELRISYLKSVLLSADVASLARALDVLCARAEQAEPAAREALVALVDALQDPALAAVVQQLREEAAGVPHLALERLVRRPVTLGAGRRGPSEGGTRAVPEPDEDRVPDYGRGRPLTLGERKSLARRPDREMTERLLRDPHPDVIRQLLTNPKVTEDDVLSLAARRPCRPDVLTQIARTPRWTHRPRIRIALVLNPDTPLDVTAPLVGLLVRQELRLVATSTTVAPALRALCLEHLERRPPSPFDDDEDFLQ
ncbi:MAG: hypothetical protein KF764_32760 [Labilithrix sp.]|nr:hypothetical protein [Labilithrix sp.]MBX3220168.1 hypothetical protein [Labilithrix sp.]